MPENIFTLLEGYRENIVRILGERFNRIILYGSYARGDFNNDSDVDIMILADVNPDEISRYADRIYNITYDFEAKYGVEINPSVQSIQVYEQWKKVYPFFINLEREGVAI